jgi:hypothetical protein
MGLAAVPDGQDDRERRGQVLGTLETVMSLCEQGLSGELDPDEAAETAAGLLSMLTAAGEQRVVDWVARSVLTTAKVANLVASGAVTAVGVTEAGERFPVELLRPLPEGVPFIGPPRQ